MQAAAGTHALRARGSIDPSSGMGGVQCISLHHFLILCVGYSKLIPLSGVVILATAANITVPENVRQVCLGLARHLCTL